MSNRTRTLIAAGCGTCGDIRATHFEPLACAACGVDFEDGAPLALVQSSFGVVRPAAGSRALITLGWNLHVDLAGRWTRAARERIEKATQAHAPTFDVAEGT